MAEMNAEDGASEMADASGSEAEDSSFSARKRQLSSSEEASEGDALPFTETYRRAKTSKARKMASAVDQPIQVANGNVTLSRATEVCVFVEFIGETISKINTVVVKKALVAVIGELKVAVSGNFLRVCCSTAEQKERLMSTVELGPYQVRVSEPRKLVKERAANAKKSIRKVVVGVPDSIEDADIMLELEASTAVLSAKRIMKKRGGAMVKTTAVILDFPADGQDIPTKVAIGFIKYRVRDYVAPPTRCYKCLAFGHVSIHCQRGQKCSICAGDHKHSDCAKKEQKCARCGGPHTVFDASCPAYAQAKLAATKAAQTGKTYAQALKTVRREAKVSQKEDTGKGASSTQETATEKETAAVASAPQPVRPPTSQDADCQTTPIEETTSAKGPEMAPFIRMMATILMKVVDYIQDSIVPKLRSKKLTDFNKETRLAFAQIMAMEMDIPLPQVLQLVAGCNVAPAPQTATTQHHHGY